MVFGNHRIHSNNSSLAVECFRGLTELFVTLSVLHLRFRGGMSKSDHEWSYALQVLE
jgi:hypothetical protein